LALFLYLPRPIHKHHPRLLFGADSLGGAFGLFRRQTDADDAPTHQGNPTMEVRGEVKLGGGLGYFVHNGTDLERLRLRLRLS
jgi:hypothetical protein